MRRSPLLLFVAVAIACGAAWLALTPGHPGFGDGPEFVLVLARNGVAHPTGYPLYTILGHGLVALLHALGVGWARAAAAWSALGGMVALVFLQLLGWRWAAPGDDRPARAVAAVACMASAILLAFNGIWLDQATLPEVHTWHIAWAMAAAWCAFGLTPGVGEAGDHEGGGPGARSAALFGFVLGLGLAHHRLSVFLAGFLALAWLARAWRVLGPRRALFGLACGAGGMLVPLLSYGWIAWRAFHPGPAQWPPLEASWSSVKWQVLGSQYRGFLGHFAPNADARRLLAGFGYPVLVPGVLVLVALAVRDWRAGRPRATVVTALVLAAIVTSGWVFGYGVPDVEPYFLLPVALGLATLAPLALWAGGARIAPWPAAARAAVASALALLLAAWAGFGVRSTRASQAADRQLEDTTRLLWQAVPDDSSLVFWPSDPFFRLTMYQQLDGEKPSLYIMTPSLLGYTEPRREFARRFGFDPLADFVFQPVRPGTTTEQVRLEWIYRQLLLHISANTPRPVYVIVPEENILRLVPKDRDPSRALARPAPPAPAAPATPAPAPRVPRARSGP